jgi:hypothetical protein
MFDSAIYVHDIRLLVYSTLSEEEIDGFPGDSYKDMGTPPK